MSETNGQAPKVTLIQVQYNHEDGSLDVAGVQPGQKVFVAWLLQRAAIAVAHQVSPKDVAFSIGDLTPNHIQVVRGPIGPHGVREP